jgi:CRP/FNR family transcriptional regulator, cyclic AMP receptor protein
MASLLKRHIDLEEDLCDQLFNHSEKRVARVRLKLARLREHAVASDATMLTLSHETAEMVGTTGSRISHFMNKFRKNRTDRIQRTCGRENGVASRHRLA